MTNQYNSKNYTSLKGKSIKITGVGSGHGYGLIGDTILVNDVRLYMSTGQNAGVMLNGSGSYIRFTEFTCSPVTRKEIEKDVKDLEESIAELKSKLAFMDAQKLDAYDETEFKVFSVLQELNTNSSEIDKARAIAKLINQ